MANEKDDIERYHKGLMSRAEMHALEKKALSDPFLADALEGSATTSPEEFSHDVEELDRKLQPAQRRTWFSPLRIAAGVILLIGAGSLFYFFMPEPQTLALQESSDEKVNADSAAGPVVKQPSSTLALAKPEESSRDKQASGKASSKKETRVGGTQSLDQTSISTRESVTIQPAPVVITEEEKAKLAAEEIADDQKELADQAIQSSAGAAADTKKEALALRSAKAKAPVLRSIAGKVTSAEDGSALPGVNVLVNGTTEGTVTNADGRFTLHTQSASPELVYSFIGKQTVTVSGARDTINIKMEDDVSQLSEVVVTGYGTDKGDDLDKEPVIKMASPKGGMRAYNKYLENSLRYPEQAIANNIKGRVTIQFIVTTVGALTEFSVIKGLGYGCDDEVIRLVKEGPAWTPTLQDNIPVESEVKVRLKFDPNKKKK